MKTVTYKVVIEDAGSNLSAYVPDLPGCVSTGVTVPEVLERMREAVQSHIEGMLEDGEQPPPATSQMAEVEALIPG